MGVEGLLLAGMILATLVCVAAAVTLAAEYSRDRLYEPYVRLYWQAAGAVLSAGFAALCLSLLKVLVRRG